MDKLLAEIREARPTGRVVKPDIEIDHDPVEVDSVLVQENYTVDLNPLSAGNDLLKWIDEKTPAIAAKLGLEDSDLKAEIFATLRSDLEEADRQARLVDLLGFEYVEFAASILTDSAILLEALDTAEAVRQRKEENARDAQNRRDNMQYKTGDAQYPHVYRKAETNSAMSLYGNEFSLPHGTTREQHGFYDKVTIPAPVADTSFHPKKLLPIDQLDELCRVTFSKYETLNKMQTLVYPVGYNTNENMLICAPTGAGKTDVALISILNTVRQHCTFDEEGSFRVNYDDFKIIYVAPLKALAAEIVEKMSSRLSWLGIRVRELTGDMQLSRQELADTQIIVTTPEKWDVVTRKPSDDTSFTNVLKLLIIDEVHLLHEDRGAVIEALVARTLRQVESTQAMIRIVGLSATLPNFLDVASFLKVNPQVGLFFFDSSFRPVPLEQQFVGVAGKAGSREAMTNLDKVCYEQLREQLEHGHQVMVFVHSRKDTAKAARTFIKMAQQNNDTLLFEADDKARYSGEMSKFRNRDFQELYEGGCAIHHAGLTRAERNLSEKLFLNGAIKVLCCTATLAWGVNLPAAVVIIKGTQVYDASKSCFMDLGISDVIQIFGRAGRPQYESVGTGILCTTRDKIDHYVSLITNQYPIESRLQNRLPDMLNAEISLGTVTNIQEGIQWLGYTYAFVRMRKAPLIYGLKYEDVQNDPVLLEFRRKLIINAATRLHEVQMIVFDEDTESFVSKETGRIASEFYLLNHTIEVFNSRVHPESEMTSLLATLSSCGEFDGIRARQEELEDLELIAGRAKFHIKAGLETQEGKTNALVQGFISRAEIKTTSLLSDLNYISQNFSRIVRAFFLLCVGRRWGNVSLQLLDLAKAVSARFWPNQHPLLQFDLSQGAMRQIEARNTPISELKNMSPKEIGELVRNQSMGARIKTIAHKLPTMFILDGIVRPITSKVLRIELHLLSEFRWDMQYHGGTQVFWVWVQEDDETGRILHSERVVLTRSRYKEEQRLDFAIPLTDPAPNQLIVKVTNDVWLGCESTLALSFKHLVTPDIQPIQTQMLKLRPLPVTTLHNSVLEQYYGKKFLFFNPMQTLCFHTLYHTKSHVLLGSPTGSGKTIAAELALWAALREYPDLKIVYIAPMKALVKERMQDWSEGIAKHANLSLVELTGDTNPSSQAIHKANIVITTPEKFDGISRNWQTRKFVQQISLVIMDEVHLLASDRGAILEMIVSRMNFVQAKTGRKIRLMGMSTAVANPGDVASWLGVESNIGLFNFPSSLRPVPLEMYIDGFPDNVGFCPLMKSMNKPAFQAVKKHAKQKPALIFVPSRRQTRLTAQDFISMCGNEENPQQFLHMDEDELEEVVNAVQDDTLKRSVQFGIVIHHAGLVDSDRRISHELFARNKCQILIATSTLAWGVNLPAYLVVVKGTQYFDSKTEKYKDMDLTDVLQMMGRAGRPAFDTSGVARIFTKQSTKSFYKYFLNVGFPVESSLHKVLEDHVGAEISARTVSTRQNILDFLQWTFLYRRVYANPTYYGIEEHKVGEWLVERVDHALQELEKSSCVVMGSEIQPTPFLRISSFYYISHKTIRQYLENIKGGMGSFEVLKCLALASEFAELPVRHNEDLQNAELSTNVPFPGDSLNLPMGSPHVKAFLLLQARMNGAQLPIEDYKQDTITVLDAAMRITQALIDTIAELGYCDSLLATIRVLRALKQGIPVEKNMASVLPGLLNLNPKLTLDEITVDSAKELRVPKKYQNSFRKVVAGLPRYKTTETSIKLRPDGNKVYCPRFHRPQVESWFVIHEIDGKVQSISRAQRPADILAQDSGQIIVTNDTLDLNYTLPPVIPPPRQELNRK